MSLRSSFKLHIGWNKGPALLIAVPGALTNPQWECSSPPVCFILSTCKKPGVLPLFFLYWLFVACYILPRYKGVEESLSESSRAFISSYRSCVSFLSTKDSRVRAGAGEVSVQASKRPQGRNGALFLWDSHRAQGLAHIAWVSKRIHDNLRVA